MNLSLLTQFINQRYDEDLIPRLVDYVRIPAKSPMFDPDWEQHGYLDQVVQQAHDWAQAQALPGLQLEILRMPGRTPCLFFQMPASPGLEDRDTVLFYGHLDKQPEMSGWRADLGPWEPKIDQDKLYGRGAADDGYACYAALTLLAALQQQGCAHPRCVGLIETSEESGSPDLRDYLDILASRLGKVGLVIGLDSGCGNYEQLWVTTSLRGLCGGTLTVDVLEEGVHSGMASGLVPSSFRIARQLLDRLDDSRTGEVKLPGLHAAIPAERLEQAEAAGRILGDQVWKQFPWVGCSHGEGAHLRCQPTTTDPAEGILNRTWRPALSITGAAGLPAIEEAGNVLRPKTAFKLSMRLPPGIDAQQASQQIQAVLEADPPYQSRVRFEAEAAADGWNAPPTAPWLLEALDQASRAVFKQPAAWIGEGGTIPFMAMLGERFPEAQFLITGVLGPQSNAHGPNEFLHLPYVKQLTAAVALVLAKIAQPAPGAKT